MPKIYQVYSSLGVDLQAYCKNTQTIKWWPRKTVQLLVMMKSRCKMLRKIYCIWNEDLGSNGWNTFDSYVCLIRDDLSKREWSVTINNMDKVNRKTLISMGKRIGFKGWCSLLMSEIHLSYSTSHLFWIIWSKIHTLWHSLISFHHMYSQTIWTQILQLINTINSYYITTSGGDHDAWRYLSSAH